MPLWRVDINGVAHRYVEADSGCDAKPRVAEAVLSGFDLQATPANAVLARAYFEAGPLKRKNLLAAVDGLAHPNRRASDRRKTRRKLARLVLHDVSMKHWVRDADSKSPVIPRPEGIDRLIESAEMDHLRASMRRLRDDEANSPFHT